MVNTVVWCVGVTLNELIKETLFSAFGNNDVKLNFPQSENELMDILNFSMPDILIINFSESRIKFGELSTNILKDPWLHQFGTIGLYSRANDEEEEIFRSYNHFNILALIEMNRIKSYLAKSVSIIAENKQLVFQGIMMGKLVSQFSGSFVIDNRDYILAPVYGALLANCLVRTQKIPLSKKTDVQMAISEIIFNSIEHGNCGITFFEKSRWLESGKFIYDLVLQRSQLSNVASKKAIVEWEISDDVSEIIIRDEGKGFDVEAYMQKTENELNETLNGRGIILSQGIVDKLVYNSTGNEAKITINSHSGASNAIPAGFAEEKILKVKAGDALMRAGEFADCLYYVSSGTYAVYLKGKLVGKITNADIFMGEMAFLLNNTRTATVVAEEKGRVVRISRKSFLNVIKTYPQYSIFLSKVLAQKLVRSNSLRAGGTD